MIGNINPSISRLKAIGFRWKVMRAKTKAAKLLTSSTPKVVDSITTMLLRSMVQNSLPVRIAATLVQSGGMGGIYGCAKASPRDLRPLNTSMTIGTRMTITTTVRMKY